MRVSGWALAMGGALIGLVVMERLRPLRKDKPQPDTRRIPHNLALAMTAAAVSQVCERPLTLPLARWVDRSGAGLLPRLGLPRPLETAVGVVLLDYSLYAWHVLLHRSPLLWNSHRVHHSDLVLDTSTALRFHGLEFLYSVPWRAAQVALLGIRPETLAIWQRLTGIEVLFHHSNLRLPKRIEDALSWLVMTPRLHGIHHSVDPQERDSNYSSGLAIWDVLHGTRKTDVPQEDVEIGVESPHSPRELTLMRLITLPFAGREARVPALALVSQLNRASMPSR